MSRRPTPRQEALALIERYGGDFNDIGGPYELVGDVWSAPGLVWRATGGHCLAFHNRVDRPAGWRSLLDDLCLGVEPCRQDDCEGCQPATPPVADATVY